MKTLVIYYSRSGNTKKVAQVIAKNLRADLEEIIDLKDRKRKIIGWVIAGRDALLEKSTKIRFKKDPSKYDMIIIGTPNWAGTLTPAIRTYIEQNKTKLKKKKLACFCTYGGNTGKIFENFTQLIHEPLITLGLKDKEIQQKAKKVDQEINEFCNQLKK